MVEDLHLSVHVERPTRLLDMMKQKLMVSFPCKQSLMQQSSNMLQSVTHKLLS